MSDENSANSKSVVLFLDFAFLITFIILIGFGVLQAQTPGASSAPPLPPNGEFLFVGLGGLCILLAPGIARRIPGYFRAALFRNVITEVGVLLGFVVTYTTRAIWPVVVLGVLGMLSVLLHMRGEGSPESDTR
jgi:hypothetical protein